MAPTVSVNLCCYNSEKYLRETLESIVNQTYQDWELIIINDGSTDTTESIVQQYISQGYPIIYYFQENHGLGYSRNEALKRSRGQYIAFIDHDDIWLPQKLEKQVFIFENQPEIDFIYSNYFRLIMPKVDRLRVAFQKKQPEGKVFKEFLCQYPVNMQTVALRKSSLHSLEEKFDEQLNLCEEYELFLRMLYYSNAAYLAQPLAIYRIHENMSSIKLAYEYPKEVSYILKKFASKLPGFQSNYSKEIAYLKAKIAYWNAKAEMSSGNIKEARDFLCPFKSVNLKFFFLYRLTFFPKKLWDIVHGLKLKFG